VSGLRQEISVVRPNRPPSRHLTPHVSSIAIFRLTGAVKGPVLQKPHSPATSDQRGFVNTHLRSTSECEPRSHGRFAAASPGAKRSPKQHAHPPLQPAPSAAGARPARRIRRTAASPVLALPALPPAAGGAGGNRTSPALAGAALGQHAAPGRSCLAAEFWKRSRRQAEIRRSRLRTKHAARRPRNSAVLVQPETALGSGRGRQRAVHVPGVQGKAPLGTSGTSSQNCWDMRASRC